jgi:hypothetical protein
MIRKYTASADNTIVNAFQPNLTRRGTGSNMGVADVMEVFSIYGRQTVSSSAADASQELSRILVKFPAAGISADRDASLIPASGSVRFYLKLYNAQTSKTVPRDYKLVVHKVSQAWEEGTGLDLDGYTDYVKGNIGSDWVQARKGTDWNLVGGDYLTGGSDPFFEQTFDTGLEDLEIDVTSIVEGWVSSPATNYGIGVKLSSSYEAYYSSSTGDSADGSVLNNTDGATTSYYTKRFFARGSQYWFKRPRIEARWDSTFRDQRNDFHYSSSVAPSADNLNTIYLYNYVRGKLVNIPRIGTDTLLVSLYSGSSDNSAPSGSKVELYDGNTNMTGGWVSTGVYSCSIGVVSSSITQLFDVWHDGTTEYFTGSIYPLLQTAEMTRKKPTYYINVTNLEERYLRHQTARLYLYVRNKNWSPTIYTVANSTVENVAIQSASYRVYRTMDGYQAIPYNTGSTLATSLSYDISGNYFDLNMDLLEPGYEYGLKFAFYNNELSSWKEQNETFRFRVEDYEY